MTEMPLDKFFLQKTDQCVMCGLCLPHCPTYKLYNAENESPRGRIALMRALTTGELTLTPSLTAHLDRCLVCRACENACPANVPYSELIDITRTVINKETAVAQRRTKPETILNNLSHLKRWRPLLTLYQRSGLQKAARTLRLPQILGLAQLEQLIPKLPAQNKWHEHYPATGIQRGQVALFTGCTGKILDGVTLTAAIKILTRLGYSVTIPPAQGCCGILHKHSGYPNEARKLALNNLKSFQTDQLDAVIYIASGCGSQLKEYKNLAGLDQQHQEQAQLFSSKTQEINQFITSVTWPADFKLSPLNKRVAVHVPCSMQYTPDLPDTCQTALKKIPQLTVMSLPDNHHCCGAAGDYMLRHPDIAGALLKPKLDTLEQLNPDIITSANIGCALHFMAALEEKRNSIEVVHPVSLLARQITDRQ